jgi:hypothetical protein
VATLVDLWKLLLDEASHLKNAQHLLLLVEECKIVCEQLDLEGIRELLYHLEEEQVEQFRQKAMLRLINVNFVDGLLLSILFLFGDHVHSLLLAFLVISPRLFPLIVLFIISPLLHGSCLPASIVILHHSRLAGILLQSQISYIRNCPYESLIIDYFSVFFPLSPDQRKHLLIVQLL